MTSSRSSKVTTLALLGVLALALAAPAAAVSVSDQTVPMEGEVGQTIEATYTLQNLYQEPNFQSWELHGATELRNVTWTVAFKNPSGDTFAQRNYNGQTFSQAGVSADSDEFDDPVTEVEVTVRGDVPPIEEFTFPEEETFVIAKLSQRAGDTGSTNTIDTWSVHQYTTGEEDEAGSKQARTAIESAQSAIQSANDAGANPEQANASLQTAIDFYELGQFQKAVANANTAEEQADNAASSSATTQTVMFAALAVVVLALLGGGVWYYQQQQDDYDKLG